MVNMSHVDVKNLKPSSFEEEYYDQYDYYNLTDKYAGESPRPSGESRTPAAAASPVSPPQRLRPGKAEPRRRRVTTPTDPVRPDTSANWWRSSRTARRRARSEREV